MADGAYRWQGNWPAPDAARIAEIDAAWEESGVEVFAESARSAAVERIERALAAARTGDLTGASARLEGHAPGEGDAPHPLVIRKAALEACRAAALQSLPLIRSAQNADARSAETLKACAEGLAAWRDDWKEALGLSGKRPKSVRPDGERMSRVRNDLKARIDRAVAELTASQSRRAEVEARMEALLRPL